MIRRLHRETRNTHGIPDGNPPGKGRLECKRKRSLVGIDVLREVKVGREKLFIHPKLIGLLTSESHTYKFYSAKPHSARKPKSAELKRPGLKAGVARTRTRKRKTP